MTREVCQATEHIAAGVHFNLKCCWFMNKNEMFLARYTAWSLAFVHHSKTSGYLDIVYVVMCLCYTLLKDIMTVIGKFVKGHFLLFSKAVLRQILLAPFGKFAILLTSVRSDGLQMISFRKETNFVNSPALVPRS